MTEQDRPWRLEVWEVDPDLLEETWRVWSTYVSQAKANSRREKLEEQGKTVRVEGPATCIHCGEAHDPPYDGMCIL